MIQIPDGPCGSDSSGGSDGPGGQDSQGGLGGPLVRVVTDWSVWPRWSRWSGLSRVLRWLSGSGV